MPVTRPQNFMTERRSCDWRSAICVSSAARSSTFTVKPGMKRSARSLSSIAAEGERGGKVCMR